LLKQVRHVSKVKSPIEKKKLSLALDRRNSYGENSKASRKGISLSKARSHRKERHAVGAVLGGFSGSVTETAELIDAEVRARGKQKKVGAFRKSPDQPLGIHIAKQAVRVARRGSRA
jgi:hypothetical protein